MKRTLFMMVLAVAVCLPVAAGRAFAFGERVVLYRIGEDAPQQWPFVERCFESRGYSVSVYQGETVVEKHIEKVNVINRTPAKIFLALQIVRGDTTRAMVAMTDEKKEEGRFLTIDEMPGRFVEKSQRLATDIAASFRVSAKHLPLFPLLGVTKPGVYVRIDYKEGDLEDAVRKLCEGVGRYFTERMAQ